MRITTAIIFLVAAILAIVGASADANRGKGKRRILAVEPTTTTTLFACPAWCAPLEPTLVPGTECDYVWNVCIADDGTGQPNCEGWTASCE